MSDALEEHDGKISIGGRNITSLREQELHALVESLEKTCRKDQTDDKQRLWHSERDKGETAEAGYCKKLQVPWSSCLRRWLQTIDFRKDCTSSFKVEAKMIRPRSNVFLFSKDCPAKHNKRKKKKRQTKEEVRIQYHRVDRNGLCQLN